MALVNDISSGVVGARWSEELTAGQADPSAVWTQLQPNSYNGFGATVTLEARRFISDSRQEEFPVPVDVEASGGMQVDFTQNGVQELMQGFMFSSHRRKNELAVATVDTTLDDFQPASGGDGYVAGDLLFAKSFDDTVNNGLHLVTGTPSASSVPVTTNLTTAATQTGTISRVGYQFGSAEVDIDVSGPLPKLVRVGGTKDLTTLGLLPGETVIVGDDGASFQFVGAENNGPKRIRSISATEIVFDKSDVAMTAETGTGLTIRLIFGRVSKNESDPTLVVKRTYQLERTLGASDDALPAQIQSEYLVGSVGNELEIAVEQGTITKANLGFVCFDHETRTGAQGVKAGTRPTLVAGPAFTAGENFARWRLALVSDVNEAPTPLSAFFRTGSIRINNNVTVLKAITRPGGFSTNAGLFSVSGELNGYFNSVDAQAAVRANSKATLDVFMRKDGQGISIDLPLIGLGDSQLNVELDDAVTIPLSMNAATAKSVAAALDHTLFMVYFDYVPAYV